jgi:hypothetical protein
MGGLAGLSAPSYMPTLFGSVSSDASLLATLSARRTEEPGTANSTVVQDQVRIGDASQVAPGAAPPDDDGGNGNARLDQTATATRWPGLIV